MHAVRAGHTVFGVAKTTPETESPHRIAPPNRPTESPRCGTSSGGFHVCAVGLPPEFHAVPEEQEHGDARGVAA